MTKKLHTYDLEVDQKVQYLYGGLWTDWTVEDPHKPNGLVDIGHPNFNTIEVHPNKLRLPIEE